MKRRTFIRGTSLSAASACLASTSAEPPRAVAATSPDDQADPQEPSASDEATSDSQAADPQNQELGRTPGKFAMAFAPHFGMFARSGGPELADQLRFAADHGFQAWEDNAMKDRSVEPHDLVMVREPLNRIRNHPGVFLHQSPHAYQICRAVGRPSCKILFDIYHQQVTEGNLIANIDRCWNEIAYFQCGDHPGRKEPGTGEIHFKNVFSHIAAKGYRGIMGMEHGNANKGIAAERAVIEAYRLVHPS